MQGRKVRGTTQLEEKIPPTRKINGFDRSPLLLFHGESSGDVIHSSICASFHQPLTLY